MGYKEKFEDFLDKMQGLLDNAKEQGHIIVRVEDLERTFPELREEDSKEKPNGGIVMEDFNEGNGFYKVNLNYLNKEQVEEIEGLVKKWNPELKESEDELKWLTKFIEEEARCLSMDIRDDEDRIKLKNLQKSLAWLEKQGDNPTPINIDKMVMEYSQTKDSDFGLPANCMIRAYRRGIIDVLNLSSGIEKQDEQIIANSTKNCKDEQNPTDKIEPKFKAGDKIIGIVSGIQYYISEVHNDFYFTETGCCIMFNAQNNFRLLEQKPVDSYCQENCKGFKETGKGFADEDCKAKREAESINKVEPKFHEKDWVVNKEGRIFQIMRIDNDFNHITYACRFIEQDTKDWVSYSEDDISLWDISNAKNGDVLASNSSTFLFSQEYIAGKPKAHCGIMNGFFIVKPEGCWTNEKIYPATKEQRYFLFTKMREAGYKWDDGKKKLEKIEQKSTDKTEFTVNNYITPNKQFFQWIYDRLINVHNENPNVDYMLSLKERIENMQKTAWSEENDMMINETLYFLREYQQSDRCKDENDMQNSVTCENWLKSLKERFGCEANCTTTKEWSEEEESIINKAESWLDTLCDYLKDSSPEYISDIKDVINKLKSIKDRYTWKPSSIQMECLHDAIEHYHTNGYPATKLTELYEQLSKIYKL